MMIFSAAFGGLEGSSPSFCPRVSKIPENLDCASFLDSLSLERSFLTRWKLRSFWSLFVSLPSLSIFFLLFFYFPPLLSSSPLLISLPLPPLLLFFSLSFSFFLSPPFLSPCSPTPEPTKKLSLAWDKFRVQKVIPELDPNPTFTLTQLPSIYSKKNFKILVPYTNLYGIKNRSRRAGKIRFSLSGYSSNRKSQSGTLVLFFWILVQKNTQTKTKRDELPAKQL